MKNELIVLKLAAKRGNVVPVSREFPADLLTPVSAYMRLCQTSARAPKQAFLFESVEGGEHVGRYSFLGVDPFERLTISNGELTVHTSGKKEIRVPGNPMKAMGASLGRFKSVTRDGLPPFTGGAVGYVGYECARYIEEIGAPAARNGPFDAQLMVFRNIVAFDHVRHCVILIHNIFLEEAKIEEGYRRALRELERLRVRLSHPARSEKALIPQGNVTEIEGLKPMLGPRAFAAGVGVIKNAIRRGDIFQCVLSDEFRFPLKTDSFSIYRALRQISPAPYLFHLAMKDEVLLGASPERLTRVGEGVVESSPIAGTRPRGRDAAEDKKFERQLLDSVKERAEHLMLVDLGRNDIGRVSRPGSVSVPSFMQVERFSHVMHLVSNVRGRLKSGARAWDALVSCFPAGTLSGAPKIRAMQIIGELEPIQRGPYGGSVVYFDFSGRFDSCITIRSLYIRDGVGRIRAGAGIVADSKAAREYDEVRNKTRAIRRAVALAHSAAKKSGAR